MMIKEVVRKIEDHASTILDFVGHIVIIKTNTQVYSGTLVGINYANQNENLESVRFYLSHLSDPIEIRIDPVTEENTSIEIM